ncbi:group II truncated hemoglobin [Thiobacter aerophilum]|uniref:Group II truncated hemoglobin n=1 Tax=Thiobacter aerophilum TaxID=3121275 RepID=A0ABV0EI63_9BURK
MHTKPDVSSPYERIGGDAGLRRLVTRFYTLMDTLPEAYAARKLHPADLSGSAEKLFDFLSGWLGGPPRYLEKHGHPMLRRRHLPYAIGPQARDEWLLCMRLALEETVADVSLRRALEMRFAELAEHLRNQGEGRQSCDHPPFPPNPHADPRPRHGGVGQV